MVEVRPAELADVPAVLGLARRMHAESPRYRGRNFDESKVERTLQAVMTGALPGGALVAVSGGTVVGMIAGFVVEQFFGPDKTASDFALYVAPEHRGGSAGVRLVKTFEKLVRALGALDLTLGISAEIDAERVAGLYERLGYRRSGFTLVKELF